MSAENQGEDPRQSQAADVQVRECVNGLPLYDEGSGSRIYFEGRCLDGR